jgi:hypothetical protein
MIIPRTPNAKTRHANDSKVWGMKGMTFLSIEKIPAVSAMGEMYNCGVRKIVRNSFLSLCLVIIGLPS